MKKLLILSILAFLQMTPAYSNTVVYERLTGDINRSLVVESLVLFEKYIEISHKDIDCSSALLLDFRNYIPGEQAWYRERLPFKSFYFFGKEIKEMDEGTLYCLHLSGIDIFQDSIVVNITFKKYTKEKDSELSQTVLANGCFSFRFDCKSQSWYLAKADIAETAER